jgi:hypothetical protein
MKDQGRFKDKFNKEEARPNRPLWNDIEKNLQKERNKRFAKWWWLPFAIFLGSGIAFWVAAPESVFRKEPIFIPESAIADNKEPQPEISASRRRTETSKFKSETQEALPSAEITETHEDRGAQQTAQKSPVTALSGKRTAAKQNIRKAIGISLTASSDKSDIRKVVKNSSNSLQEGFAKTWPIMAKADSAIAENIPAEESQKTAAAIIPDQKQDNKDSLIYEKSSPQLTVSEDSGRTKSLLRYHILAGAFYSNKIQELNRFAYEARQRNLGRDNMNPERFSFSYQMLVSKKIRNKWHGGLGTGFTYMADRTVIGHRARTGSSAGSLMGNGWEEIKPGYTEIQRTTITRMGLLDFSASVWSMDVAGPFGFRLGGIWSLPVVDHFSEEIAGKSSSKTNWLSGQSFGTVHAGLPVSLRFGGKKINLEPQILYPLQSVFDNGFGSRSRPIRWGIQLWMDL